jgi:hypothetical protein
MSKINTPKKQISNKKKGDSPIRARKPDKLRTEPNIRTQTKITPTKTKRRRPTKAQKEAQRKFAERCKKGYKFQKSLKAPLEKKHGPVFSEVHTKRKGKGGKRIDWVTQTGRPISVKRTRWDKAKSQTLNNYIYEASNYPGRKIRSNNVPKSLEGKRITGKPILAVPKLANPNTPQAQQRLRDFKKQAAKKGVSVELYPE